MMKWNPLVQKLFRGKPRTMVVLVVIVVAVVALGTVLWIYTDGMRLVHKAEYQVSVPTKPGVFGVLYSTPKGGYLLVLSDAHSRELESYYVDVAGRQIGRPDFGQSKYVRLSRWALVDEDAVEGFGDLYRLTADWQVSGGEVRIRITGSPPDVRRADPCPNREELERQSMPIAYHTEIVLTMQRG